jgi:hypothetical protein
MDDAEIDRLRKEICRSYNSSPHKKKVWLALLEMHAGAKMLRRPPGRKRAKDSEARGEPTAQKGSSDLF